MGYIENRIKQLRAMRQELPKTPENEEKRERLWDESRLLRRAPKLKCQIYKDRFKNSRYIHGFIYQISLRKARGDEELRAEMQEIMNRHRHFLPWKKPLREYAKDHPEKFQEGKLFSMRSYLKSSCFTLAVWPESKKKRRMND